MIIDGDGVERKAKCLHAQHVVSCLVGKFASAGKGLRRNMGLE